MLRTASLLDYLSALVASHEYDCPYQYPRMVQLVQVWRSIGVTSRSMLLQVPEGAQLDSSFCKTQPSRVALRLALLRRLDVQLMLVQDVDSVKFLAVFDQLHNIILIPASSTVSWIETVRKGERRKIGLDQIALFQS
ncbi:hypothetical protein LTR15_010505 [Elasticomyces elasticus]|nr:hypothetical protein LTR15_010505 [Elasticomyces elasticus]